GRHDAGAGRLDGGERTGGGARGAAARDRAPGSADRGRRRAPRAGMSEARALLARALRRRAPLRGKEDTTAVRWLNGAADGAPGLTLDLFADVAVLSTYGTEDPAPIAEEAAALLPLRAVYHKRRPREAGTLGSEERAARAPALPLRGAPVESVDVQEKGLTFRIRPAEGLAVGLYLDMREARSWVRTHARGTTLLNCFAYTGGFGVAARAGGAERAVDVDLSRRSLAWAEENARLNGQSPPPGDRVAGDAFDWLRRLGKRGGRFGAGGLEPPGFRRGPAGALSPARALPGPGGPAPPAAGPRGRLAPPCSAR